MLTEDDRVHVYCGMANALCLYLCLSQLVVKLDKSSVKYWQVRWRWLYYADLSSYFFMQFSLLVCSFNSSMSALSCWFGCLSQLKLSSAVCCDITRY